MYLDTSKIISYEVLKNYHYLRYDVFSGNEEREFLNKYLNYPDDYFGIVCDFCGEAEFVSIYMIRKAFCIDLKKAERLFNDLYLHEIISVKINDKYIECHKPGCRELETAATTGKFIEIENYRENHNYTEDYMRRFPICLFKNAVSIDEISIDESQLEKEAAHLLDKTMHVASDFSPKHSEAVQKLGNCLVAECRYDDSERFIKQLYINCSPCDIDIVLYGFADNYWAFPHILHQLDFEWLKNERNERGYRQSSLDQLDSIKAQPQHEKVAKLVRHDKPIVVIVNEINVLLENKRAKRELRELLVDCDQFKISFVFFSKYSVRDLALQGIKRQLSISDPQHIATIFNEEDTQEKEVSFLDADNMTGIEFEEFCMGILNKNGFENVRMTTTSGDYGGDLLAEKDEIKYVVQCKRYDSSIGINAVQEVIGSRVIYNCHVGVVLTNNYFTKNAEILAEKTNILLWNRNRLKQMYDNVH